MAKNRRRVGVDDPHQRSLIESTSWLVPSTTESKIFWKSRLELTAAVIL